MTIKEVEKKLNILRANIRFYEKEGLLDPKRNENEYRNYNEGDLKRLEKILLFRKCNVSIENIRLIFNGEKNIAEVFKEQITIIENEIKQLDGAKMMCKKLAEETSNIDKIDIQKYIDMMNIEERNGNKFYNITEDYILATEKLYQSIIDNKKFKGDDRMKKGLKIGLYILSSVLLFVFLILFDYIFAKNIDWVSAIILAAIFTVVDLIVVRKYLEAKSDEKFTKKQNIIYFMATIIIMVITILGYYSIKQVYIVNKEPNSNILELSVKKTLIEIARNKYQNMDNIYAEGHKIIDYEVKGNDIYVYIVANYGNFSKGNCEAINDTKNTLTIIYNKFKNQEGFYELKEYKENYIPSKLKEKTNVNYDDNYLKKQINNYCNN